MDVQHALRAWPLMGNREANRNGVNSSMYNDLHMGGGRARRDNLAQPLRPEPLPGP